MWQPVRAINLLQRASTIDPDDDLAALTLGDALVKNGQTREAEDVLRELNQRRTDNVRVRLALANVALRRNAYEEARQYLLPVLTDPKESARVHYMLGIVELNSGNMPKAIGMLRRATHLAIKESRYHHTLAVAFAMQKKYAQAEAEFKTALSLSPRSSETIHALAQVVLNGGNPNEAMRLLGSYVEANPGDIEGRILLARAYREVGRHAMARSIIKTLLQENDPRLTVDRRVGLLNDMAVSYLADRQPEEAEIALRRAIEIGPQSSSLPYENIARVYLYFLERPEASLPPLRKSRQLFPASQMTSVILAIALASCRDLESALQELIPLWKRGDAEESVYVCLGWLYQDLGNSPTAISVLSEGLVRFPGSLLIINNLGYVYLMIGDVKNARRVLNEVPKDSALPMALVATFGLLRLWEGNEQQGREMYERAEKMAGEMGHLVGSARRVRQKKHLELARMFIRNENLDAAAAEIRKGLAMKDFPLSFRNDLIQLAVELSIGELRSGGKS